MTHDFSIAGHLAHLFTRGIDMKYDFVVGSPQKSVA